MHQVYRKEELIKLIEKTERHLKENYDDIVGYYSELKYARRINNYEYWKDCLNWINVSLNTHRHLIDEYNLYTNKLSYTFY